MRRIPGDVPDAPAPSRDPTRAGGPPSPPSLVTATGSPLPTGIGAPAARALVAAGYQRLEQLNGESVSDLSTIPGVGPITIRILRRALVQRGMTLA